MIGIELSRGKGWAIRIFLPVGADSLLLACGVIYTGAYDGITGHCRLTCALLVLNIDIDWTTQPGDGE